MLIQVASSLSYGEAVPFFRKALDFSEREFGPEHAKTVELLISLAGLYFFLGRYADAEPLLERVVGIRERNFGPNHLDTARSLNNLAYLYSRQACLADADAEPLYKRALTIQEKALGLEHPNVATSLNNLAVLYQNQSPCAEAIGPIRRDSAIYGHRAARRPKARS